MTERSGFPAGLAALIAAASILSGLAAGFLQRDRQDRLYTSQFAGLTSEFSGLIADRFQLYEYGLRGARGVVLTAGPDRITRLQFERYYESRELRREFPGARGIGYTIRVANAESAAFAQAARADNFPLFAIRELAPNDGERFVIKYIYPLEGNGGATGLDIASEANRRGAAIAAARSGNPQLTAPITLVQATGEVNHGFLLLLPVYAGQAHPANAEERLAATVGWTYSPLVVGEVLHNLGPRRDEIAFSLTDTAEETSFYASPGFDPAAVTDGRLATTAEIVIFGRRWLVRYHILPAFLAKHGSVSPWLLGGVIAGIGLLLAIAAYGIARNRERSGAMKRQQEHFAYGIVDAAPQALIVADEDGRIVRANPFAAGLFGWSTEALAGKAVEDLMPAEYRIAHAQQRRQYDQIAKVMGRQREVIARRRDGSKFPAQIHLAPMDIGGQRLVVAGVTDVSAEREAIKVLSAAQQRWQELANTLPQLVWTCDASGTCDFLSEQWVRYTGIPAEAQLGAGWLDQVHPDDRDGLVAAWQESVATSTSFRVEFRIRRHDGQYRLFYTRAEPILDSAGKVMRWIGSNTDIEERYQAEQKVRALLEEMEARVAERTADLDTARRDLENILNAIPSMIAYWDSNLHNRFANHAYEHWFGVTPGWLKGRHMRELLGDALFEKNRPFVEAALRGEPQRFERDLTDQTGKTHATQAHYLPDIRNGTVLGFYVLVFDVSDLKASEVAQKAAREAAEEATRAKSAFLTSMSHELRTPMNSILGFADLLVGQFFGQLNDKQAEYAGIIKKSGEHLLKLMDEVLELSKIEAGRISVSIEPVNVVATVKSAVATLQPLAERNRVTIDARGVAPDDLFISADLTRISQILINLGSNAIKYNRRGGWVKFSCETLSDDFVRIRVADNGRGIPQDRQAGAFQAFNRMGAEQGMVEGTGVGLALVKNLAEMMGGRVGFESTEGEGSVFWVDLLKADADSVDDLARTEAGLPVQIPAATGPMRVLYVEDNENNRQLFRHFMAVLKNVEVIEAADGLGGLHAARTRRPDLIFLDINLPGMNGYDVLREIKADPALKAIPVIALTANAMSGDAERGIAMGFDRYLEKPVRLDQILRTVQAFQDQIEERRAEQAADS